MRFVGAGSPALLDNMLSAIDYRGDRSDVLELGEVGLGYRWWQGRPGKATGIERDKSSAVACAGTFAPPVTSLPSKFGGAPKAALETQTVHFRAHTMISNREPYRWFVTRLAFVPYIIFYTTGPSTSPLS